MAASHRGVCRLRIYVFARTDVPGQFTDICIDDFTDTYDGAFARVRETLENIPADHFAIVCDSLPYTAIPLGHEGASVELDPVSAYPREIVDSTSQGLARHKASPEVDSGIGERAASSNMDYGREHL